VIEFGFDIDGLEGMEKALLELGTELGGKTVKSALMKAGSPLLKEMKRLVPFDEKSKNRHHLKASLGRRSKILKSGVVQVQVGALKKSSGRAGLIERGTVRTRAQPFIKPAENKYPESLALFIKELARKIEIARKANL